MQNRNSKVENGRSASLVQNGLLAEAISVKPILFSTPMVQAILDGRKKQTRRIIKNVPNGLSDDDTWSELLSHVSPYGHDLLWVRETWRPIAQDFGKPRYEYKATEKINLSDKWRPSIFMPKTACRIFLKIKTVTVQKLHDINEEDAVNEGISRIYNSTSLVYKNYLFADDSCDAIKSFQSLWQKINGEDSWNNNPWVWVVEFELTDCPPGFC